LLHACQYENAEELYYSNNTVKTAASKLLIEIPFNGSIKDESGNEIDIEVHGSPNFTSNRFNQANKALFFNGSNQYIEFDIGDRDSLSVSFWFNCGSDKANFSSIFDYGRNAIKTNIDGYSGPTSFNVTSFYSNFDELNANYKFRYHDWYHVYVSAGSENTIYVNGEKAGQIRENIILKLSNSYLVMGKSVSAELKDESYFYGAIDDIKVYNYLLSPLEIKELFNAPQNK